MLTIFDAIKLEDACACESSNVRTSYQWLLVDVGREPHSVLHVLYEWPVAHAIMHNVSSLKRLVQFQEKRLSSCLIKRLINREPSRLD